jgi:hypothetical protein
VTLLYVALLHSPLALPALCISSSFRRLPSLKMSFLPPARGGSDDLAHSSPAPHRRQGRQENHQVRPRPHRTLDGDLHPRHQDHHLQAQRQHLRCLPHALLERASRQARRRGWKGRLGVLARGQDRISCGRLCACFVRLRQDERCSHARVEAQGRDREPRYAPSSLLLPAFPPSLNR